jgi:hypothetical protein
MTSQEKQSILTQVSAAMAAAPETAYAPEVATQLADLQRTAGDYSKMQRTSQAALQKLRLDANGWVTIRGSGRCGYRIANGKKELAAFADYVSAAMGEPMS